MIAMPAFRVRAIHLLPAMAIAAGAAPLHAHDVPEHRRAAMTEGSLIDYAVAGAEHMVTGLDHLLFLLGVVFFLRGFRDIALFVTAFTLGHIITLLGGTWLQVQVDPLLVDAVIAATVIYKGFENLDGFPKLIGVRAPNLVAMVFLFGLVHGLGLATRLQALLPPSDPRVIGRVIAFNVGVELGQIAALAVMLPIVMLLRRSAHWQPIARITNGALIVVGCLLLLLQLHDYRHGLEPPAHDAAPADGSVTHSHDGGPPHTHPAEPVPADSFAHP